MKFILTILLIVCTGCMAYAQNTNNIYADIGCNNRGGSATYDRKLTKHFDIGAGVSFYDVSGNQYHNIQFATFIDLRPYWVKKRNLYFVIGDIGMVFYSGRIPDPNVATLNTNSPYAATGFGYCYRINKRGMGPYASLRSDWTVTHQVNHNPALVPDARDYKVLDMELMLAVGFKF